MRPCEVTRDGFDKLVCFLGHLQRTSPIYHLRPSLNSLPPPPRPLRCLSLESEIAASLN